VKVSDSELVASLNRATAMIYTPRLEPFGFAPLEAAACGLPVVGINEGGVRETVRNGVTGFLVDADPQAAARALEKIFESQSLGRELGATARGWVRDKWTVDQAIDRLQAKLFEVIANRRRRFES
jgi:glycosyltransferase involved in cell wall biosynthesis